MGEAVGRDPFEAYMKLESIITSSPRATITINHIERMIIEWLKSDSENVTLVATRIYSMLEDKTK